MAYFEEPISEYIWDIKYRYRLHHKIIDENIEASWRRVANAAAQTESVKLQSFWQKKFYSILENFYFLPGGRILAGAGTQHRVTLFNCFVMPIKEDSLTGIFNAIKEGALTLQQGGGIGYDFSKLRPNGTLIKKTDTPASGPVSFMHIWNSMCATMLSSGARRGAMMGVLRCDHPDIEEFIAAKKNPQALRNFNVSVLVTDEFMQAVKADSAWELVFPSKGRDKSATIVHRRWSGSAAKIPCKVIKKINARELWHSIMHAAYLYAEPGVLFEDTINRMNNLWYCESISATNPCGELPLPDYGACNLGSINLAQFVLNPFTPTAKIEWNKLDEVTSIATRFLDNIIDVTRYPLKPQKQQALSTRRIGLGITGLADLLVMLGVRYGEPESLKIAQAIMQRIATVTWNTSIELAQEKGSFPFFKKEQYLQGEFVQGLPSVIQKQIAQVGIRNSHHNTIAPTGTISLLANNVSNGLEPIFSARYDRQVRVENSIKTFKVNDYAIREWQKKNPSTSLPPAWIDTQTLTVDSHLNMQRAVQPFIDNAISKTINIPADFPFEELSNVYTKAYEYGLKGCTVFRPNATTGSVLSVNSNDDDLDKCCKI